MSLGLVQRMLSDVGFAPSAASVEHVNGPTSPIISRSYVDTEFHGSLNSPVVNFADSNESLPSTHVMSRLARKIGPDPGREDRARRRHADGADRHYLTPTPGDNRLDTSGIMPHDADVNDKVAPRRRRVRALTMHQRRSLQAEAACAEKTVLRWMRGENMKPAVRERLDAAAAKLGIA